MMIAYQEDRMQDSREGGRSHDEYDRNTIHRRTAGDPGGKDMENKLAENTKVGGRLTLHNLFYHFFKCFE